MSGSRTQHNALSPPITAADLYGSSGRPHGSDITQGALGDCYLVSTLGQYADRQPGVIRDAIHYRAKDQTFGVRLHDDRGKTRTITVSQDELRQDRSYGSTRSGGVDSPAYWSSTHADGSRPPAWPGVMEVAYAKLHAVSPKDPMTTELSNIGNGGWPKNAIHALTGQSDTREIAPSDLRDPNRAYAMLDRSIREHRPILLATNPMKDMPTDGLVKGEYYGAGDARNSGHAYTVEGVGKDKDGNVSLTLRNPWGTNKNQIQGVNSSDPIVHVGLKTILENGHLQNVTVGPGVVQKQRASPDSHEQDAARQGATPGAQAGGAAIQPGRSQAGFQDPARAYWSGLAAAGPERSRSLQGERQADAALGTHAGTATSRPEMMRIASDDPARACWSNLAATGRETRDNPQGVMPTDAAPGAHAGTTTSRPDRIQSTSDDPARAYWSKLAAAGPEARSSVHGAAQVDGAVPGQARGRSL